MGMAAGLIEKDYWIMHVLYGLKSQGFEFELKGSKSLSNGYHIIDRFSEDIDKIQSFLKKSLISLASSKGCSTAAKCPPAGIIVQCCILNPFSM